MANHGSVTLSVTFCRISRRVQLQPQTLLTAIEATLPPLSRVVRWGIVGVESDWYVIETGLATRLPALPQEQE